jgi:hypothetical protein
MARHIPANFLDKVHLVRRAVDLARGDERRFFEFTREVAPGVRLVVSEAHGEPVVFALWSYPADVVELCGDAAYPASAALLSIEKEQARALSTRGVFVDLSQFVRSESNPGTYYVLLDHASPERIERILRVLVPSLQHDSGKPGLGAVA